MAKKASEKKVSVNNIDKIIENDSFKDTKEFTIDFNSIEILIKPQLTLENVIGFTNSVVESVFSEGVYTPEFKDIALKRATLFYYTNLKVDFNINKLCDLVNKTDIINIILSHIDEKQYNIVVSAINDKIEYLKNLSIHKNETNDTFNSLLELLYNKFSGIDIENVTKALEKVNGITEDKIINSILDKNENNNVEISVTTNTEEVDK